jgi:hypothetical protein
MEHRVEITISEHGRAADNGDRLLGGFHGLSPEVDAVIDQNTETGHLTATFFVYDDDAQEAVERGAHIFAAALVEAGLVLARSSTFAPPSSPPMKRKTCASLSLRALSSAL